MRARREQVPRDRVVPRGAAAEGAARRPRGGRDIVAKRARDADRQHLGRRAGHGVQPQQRVQQRPPSERAAPLLLPRSLPSLPPAPAPAPAPAPTPAGRGIGPQRGLDGGGGGAREQGRRAAAAEELAGVERVAGRRAPARRVGVRGREGRGRGADGRLEDGDTGQGGPGERLRRRVLGPGERGGGLQERAAVAG